jgi:hypothetical protein
VFEASPDRCGHCGNKSIVHPVKLFVCVRRAADTRLKLVAFYQLVHAYAHSCLRRLRNICDFSLSPSNCWL